MTGEPWFDSQTAGMVGGLVGAGGGLWGAAIGTLGGLLVPKGKGKGLVFGLLYLGLITGIGMLATGLVALVSGQPWGVWFVFLNPGFILTLLSGLFLFGVRRRYQQVELRKMQAEEIT